MHAPGLDLLHRPDLPALIARWQRGVSGAELQSHYESLRHLADHTTCHRWLLDLRRRGDLADPAANQWFGEVFAPSLRGRYPAPVRLAFLLSPLSADDSVSAQVSPHTTDCAVATFLDEAAAYAWLGL